MGGGRRLAGWLVYGLAVVTAFSVACAKGKGSETGSSGVGSDTPDGGTVTDPGDAGQQQQPDAGPAPDGGTDAGVTFGGPGPWPTGNVTFTQKEGLLAGDLGGGVVGITTDETQNIWVATHGALYVMRAPTATRPGDTTFQLRFDGSKGKHLKAPNSYAPDTDLHLQNNPIEYFDNGLAGGGGPEKILGAASDPGIMSIVGGGPNEVFVGYFSFHDFVHIDPNDSTSLDPNRHTGKVDRVRLKDDGSIEVVRFDLVSGNTTQFWHCRNIYRMVYDHFIHKHELYVGTEHGIDKISPDKWFQPLDASGNPKAWVYTDNQYWMSDHLHPRVCKHQECSQTNPNANTQMMGDWAGLAIAPDGDLWVGGKWSAGKIIYTPLAAELNPDGTPNPGGKAGWYQRLGSDAYSHVFGDPWCGSSGIVDIWNGSAWVTTSCSPGTGTPPVFMPPEEGDPVFINGVTVAPNGVVWWSSPQYGIATFQEKVGFRYFDPSSMGVGGTVTDIVALPDGRIAIGSAGGGVTLWDPATRTSKSIRGGSGLPDDHVNRMELDTMVNPPALHVATATGAATIRVFP